MFVHSFVLHPFSLLFSKKKKTKKKQPIMELLVNTIIERCTLIHIYAHNQSFIYINIVKHNIIDEYKMRRKRKNFNDFV